MLDGASLKPLTCTVDSETWSTGADLTVGQQLVCSSDLEFDQAAVEAGSLSPVAIVKGSNLAQIPVDLPLITVINRPSMTVTVDQTTCTRPKKAGERA